MTLVDADLNPAHLSRRDLLRVGAALTLTDPALALSNPADANERDLSEIKALVFDVYGTCADYWGTFVRQGQAINRKKGLDIDWDKLSVEWHGLYPPSFAAMYKGQRPWESFATLRSESLDKLIRDRGIHSFSEAELADINSVWQRLDLWPDTLAGLHRLKRRYTLATLSNADMADIVKLAKHSGLPWDMILTAELAQSVKPDPKVYQVVPRYLGLKPEEIMMVACHKADLQGAAAQGLRTAFVARPLETGSNVQVDIHASDEFDLNVTSFGELADLSKD
jgi:2-haloacid dehalogenase